MPVHPNSLKNLKKGKKFSEWDDAERKKANSRGGKKSVVTRQENKKLSVLADIFGSATVDDGMKNKLKEQGIAEEDMVQDMALIYGLYTSAKRGNSNAARVLAELKGELKQQQTNVNVTNNVNPYAGLSEEELRILAREE